MQKSSPSSATACPFIPFGFEENEKLRNGRVWFQGDKMYFSPNTQKLVYVPEFHSHENWTAVEDKISIDLLTTPQWYRGPNYAWLSLIPVGYETSQSGSLFDLFKNYNLPTSTEYDPDTKLYAMPGKLRREWKTFEDNALDVIGTLHDHLGAIAAQIYTLPPPSQMTGYANQHRSAFAAIREAYNSVPWFNVLIGALFYCCMRGWSIKPVQEGKEVDYRDILKPPSAREGEHTKDPMRFLPSWFVRVASVRPELVPFLSQLRFTFSNLLPRISHVGMFICLEDALSIGGLAFFVLHQVPIAYPWGDEEENIIARSPHLAYYRPPSALVKSAISQKNGLSFGLPLGASIYSVDDYSIESFAKRAPTPPSSSSWQLEDQTMQEFFEIQELLATAQRRRATPSQLQKYDTQKHPSRNTKVFYWNENSAGAMIRIRLPSFCRIVLERDGSPYQRRYNSAVDEVDYAITFDPQLRPASNTFRPDDIAAIDQRMRDRLHSRFPSFDECTELEEADWTADSVLDLAAFRFGFIKSLDVPQISATEADSLWSFVASTLQLFSPISNKCPDDIRPFIGGLSTFFKSFVTDESGEEGEISEGPGHDIWDAHSLNVSLCASPAVRSLVRLSSGHVLVGPAEDCPWSLVVSSDVDALHASRLRDTGLSIVEITRYFIDRGIPCRTMVPFSERIDVHRLTFPANELRLQGYEFTLDDYLETRRLRRQILSHPWAALCALKLGGIVWRIARDETGLIDRELLMNGPDLSGNADVAYDVEGWIDNQLAPEHVAAICGVYIVPTYSRADWEQMTLDEIAGPLNSDDSPSHSRSTLLTTSTHPFVAGLSRFSPYPAPSTSTATVRRSSQRAKIPTAPSFLPVKPEMESSNLLQNSSRRKHHANPASQAPPENVGEKGKAHKVRKMSWFPTPETFNSPRKGAMGRWTGRMEEEYLRRVEELKSSSVKPQSATQWGKDTFGPGKRIWRLCEDASKRVIDSDYSVRTNV